FAPLKGEPQGLLHLRDGIVPDDIERHPTGLRLAQPSGLMFFLRFERQDEIGIVNVLNQSTWYAAALNRLFEAVGVHCVWEDTYCLPSGTPWGSLPWLVFIVQQCSRLGLNGRLVHLKPAVRRAHS